MLPIHFGARDRQLFGVYEEGHAPRRRMAVVILSPIGWEGLRAHRTLRLLATRLAEAGYDVLRFDYSGTGDSWGDLGDGITLARWIDDVGEAIEEVMGMSGAARVSLIGLRAGAAIGAEVAARRPRGIEQVILWDPPIVTTEQASGIAAEPTPYTDVPDSRLRAELDALTVRTAMSSRVRMHLALSEHGHRIPEPLRAAVAGVLSVEGSPTCWLEERDYGAGAVPTELLGRLVQALGE